MCGFYELERVRVLNAFLRVIFKVLSAWVFEQPIAFFLATKIEREKS
jgi:hypothetical protein